MDRIILVKQIIINMIETTQELLEDDEYVRMIVDMTYASVLTCLLIYLITRLVWCCCPDPLMSRVTEHIQHQQEKLEEAEGTIGDLEFTIEEQEGEIENLKKEIAELKADYMKCRSAAIDLISKMTKEHTE